MKKDGSAPDNNMVIYQLLQSDSSIWHAARLLEQLPKLMERKYRTPLAFIDLENLKHCAGLIKLFGARELKDN